MRLRKLATRARDRVKRERVRIYGTISSAIVCKNLPTLVPPYFCIIHLPFAGFPLSGTGVEGEESEQLDVDIKERCGSYCWRPSRDVVGLEGV